MTEAEWLASEDPAAMLGHLTHRRLGMTAEGEEFVTPRTVPLVSPRKLRLFACACWRQARADLWYKDGDYPALEEDGYVETPDTDPAYLASIWAKGKGSAALVPQATKAALLRCLVGNPWRPAYLGSGLMHVEEGALVLWERHLTPTVLALAREAYERREGWDRGETVMGHRCVGCGARKGERCWCRVGVGLLDPHRLGVLADALEDAGMPATVECEGCDATGALDTAHRPMRVKCLDCIGTGRLPHPLLAHLRSPGPHVRGCWAVDLLLGRE